MSLLLASRQLETVGEDVKCPRQLVLADNIYIHTASPPSFDPHHIGLTVIFLDNRWLIILCRVIILIWFLTCGVKPDVLTLSKKRWLLQQWQLDLPPKHSGIRKEGYSSTLRGWGMILRVGENAFLNTVEFGELPEHSSFSSSLLLHKAPSCCSDMTPQSVSSVVTTTYTFH